MTPADWEQLTPLLVHIQAHLEEGLQLEQLSDAAHCSPWQLHRRFKRLVGETPTAYVARLRLERAAFQLLVRDAPLVDIALDCGYRNHETFTRAFRRHFGVAPSAYRSDSRRHRPSIRAARSRDIVQGAASYELSRTRVVRHRELHLAFCRHIGPYENVPESLFDTLESWARRHRLAPPRTWLGIGHDAPGITPPERLRFDAALIVPAPFASEGKIGCQTLPAADYAVTTHVGTYASLPDAYREILPRVTQLKGYALVGLPVVEIYHTAHVSTQHELNHTDLCLPVERRAR